MGVGGISGWFYLVLIKVRMIILAEDKFVLVPR